MSQGAFVRRGPKKQHTPRKKTRNHMKSSHKTSDVFHLMSFLTFLYGINSISSVPTGILPGDDHPAADHHGRGTEMN